MYFQNALNFRELTQIIVILYVIEVRTSHHRYSIKNVFLEIWQNSQENTVAIVSFLIKMDASFIEKESLTQVFFCEFCEISKNIFFTEHH